MSKQNNTTLQIKLTVEEKRQIEANANAVGMSMSEYLRDVGTDPKKVARKIQKRNETKIRSSLVRMNTYMNMINSGIEIEAAHENMAKELNTVWQFIK